MTPQEAESSGWYYQPIIDNIDDGQQFAYVQWIHEMVGICHSWVLY